MPCSLLCWREVDEIGKTADDGLDGGTVSNFLLRFFGKGTYESGERPIRRIRGIEGLFIRWFGTG